MYVDYASLEQTKQLITRIHERGEDAIKQITDQDETLTERLYDAANDYFRFSKSEQPDTQSLRLSDYKQITQILDSDEESSGRKTGVVKRIVKKAGYAWGRKQGKVDKTQTSAVWRLVEEAFLSIDAGVRGRAVSFQKLSNAKPMRSESKTGRMVAMGGVELPGLGRSRRTSLQATAQASASVLPRFRSLEEAAEYSSKLDASQLKALGGRQVIAERLLEHYRNNPPELGRLLNDLQSAAAAKMGGDYRDPAQKLIAAAKALMSIVRDELPQTAKPLRNMQEALRLWAEWGKPETSLAYEVLAKGLVDALLMHRSNYSSETLFQALGEMLVEDGPEADLAAAVVNEWLGRDACAKDLYDPTLPVRSAFDKYILSVRVSEKWVKESKRPSAFEMLAKAKDHRMASRTLALAHCLVKGTRDTTVFLRQMLVELNSEDNKRMNNALDLLRVWINDDIFSSELIHGESLCNAFDAVVARCQEIAGDIKYSPLHPQVSDLLPAAKRLQSSSASLPKDESYSSSVLGMSEDTVRDLFDRILDGQWDSKEYRSDVINTLQYLASEAHASALARIKWPLIARAHIDPQSKSRPIDEGLHAAINYSNRLEERLRAATFGRAQSLAEVESIFRCLDAVAAASLQAGDFATATVIAVILVGTETRDLVQPFLKEGLKFQDWLTRMESGAKERRRAGTELEDIRQVSETAGDHKGYTQRLRSATERSESPPVIPKISYHHAKLQFALEKIKGDASLENLAEYAEHVRDFRDVAKGLHRYRDIENHRLFAFLLGDNPRSL